MRKEKETIIKAEIRRLLRIVGRRYHGISEMDYPDFIHKEEELIQDTAIKIYELLKKDFG